MKRKITISVLVIAVVACSATFGATLTDINSVKLFATSNCSDTGTDGNRGLTDCQVHFGH